MRDRFGPSAALDSSAFYSLYLGGLAFEDEQRRRRACTVLLLAGRLGLRPGELQHLHEGWVDWQRGVIRVPELEPCACEHCWEAARQAKRTGDGRELGDIVAAQQWSPPTEAGDRAIAFGWSRRLTAVLAAFFDASTYLDADVSAIRNLLRDSARAATGIDAEAVDVTALRASAATFFAEAGFDAPRVAGLLGTDVETAAPFARQTGGYARDHLYALADAAPPTLGSGETDYPLVTDHSPFDREPFDPREYDAEWRVARAEDQAGRRQLRNPRPDATPDAADYDPSDHADPTHLDGNSEVVATDGSAPVATTIDAWVGRQERQRRGADGGAGTVSHSSTQSVTETGEQTGNTDQQPGTGTDTLDPEAAVTEPVVATVSTKLAAADLADGTPTAGEVMVGQEELVLVAGDADPTDAYCIDFERIEDVAIDHTPSGLEESFDSTVGVAYGTDDGRHVAVVELPGKKRYDFSGALFKLLLNHEPVVTTHPARQGGRVTDEDPQELLLHIDSQKMEFGDAGDTEFGIRLSDIIHVERGTQTYDTDRFRGLSIRHLRPDGQAVTTAIAPVTQDNLKLLERYVMRNYRERKQQAEAVDLSADQKEVLVALYSTGGGMDLSMILDMEADELTSLLGSLKDAGLVRSGGNGAKLTGMGQMIVSDKVDDVNV